MSPPAHFFCTLAEEQVHEEVAKRCWSLQCAGGRGGLPGCAICGVCSFAASCDAGSLNRGSCSHKVAQIHGIYNYVDSCTSTLHATQAALDPYFYINNHFFIFKLNYYYY